MSCSLSVIKAECEDLEQQVGEFTANILLGPRELFEVPRDQLVIAHGMVHITCYIPCISLSFASVALLQKHKIFVERNRDQLERIQRLQNKLIEVCALPLMPQIP